VEFSAFLLTEAIPVNTVLYYLDCRSDLSPALYVVRFDSREYFIIFVLLQILHRYILVPDPVLVKRPVIAFY